VPSHRRAVHRSPRAFVAALLALVLGLSVVAASPAAAADGRSLTVMTRNLYLGASLDSAILAQDTTEFLVAVATIYATVQFTDFATRSEAVADEIAAAEPDLVGLQEVSNWVAIGPTAAPSIDFLTVLMEDLADRGLSYSVAAVSENATVGPVPLVAPCDGDVGACLLIFQDRDVILVNDARRGLSVSNPQSALYEAQAVLDTPVGPLSFSRGWASVDATLRGRTVRFVNTHLETGAFPSVQEAQAAEFLAGPVRGPGVVIAVGDFNSAADGSTTATYEMLVGSGLDDVWRTQRRDPGLTCCQNETLTNPVSELATRIDLVLTSSGARPTSASVVGDTPFQAVPPFWASDHAGVVATIRLR
jgi:endonuclease/exonuclease/phosphatase family metal-dependent hydrolase